MVVVKKKDDSVHICIDPTELNKALKRLQYPMRTVEDVASPMPNAMYSLRLTREVVFGKTNT